MPSFQFPIFSMGQSCFSDISWNNIDPWDTSGNSTAQQVPAYIV